MSDESARKFRESSLFDPVEVSDTVRVWFWRAPAFARAGYKRESGFIRPVMVGVKTQPAIYAALDAVSREMIGFIPNVMQGAHDHREN